MADELTLSKVRDIPAPTKGAISVWDSEVKGFGVRVFAATKRHPDGARSFFVNYRIDGTERRFTIGAWPGWTVSAARTEARALRRRIDRGEDPAADKRARREAPTMRDLAERYRVDHLQRKSAKSQHDDWSMIGRHILPRLEHRKVADVHHGDIVALHRGITESGHPVLANRVVSVASRMFALSLKPLAGEDAPWRDHAQGNPCKGIERNHEEAHERFLSSAEIAALTDALAAYPVTSASDCIRLLMLTGCRPGEAMLATWEQFDAEPGHWIKPSAHTKTRKVHKVPLNPAALELIDRVRRVRRPGGRYVFPGQRAGEPLKQLWHCWFWLRDHATVALWTSSADQQVAKVAADLAVAFDRPPSIKECRAEADRRGVKLPAGLTDARIYDLRHTFASVGAGGGLSLPIIGRLLGHTQARTTQRYAHLADDPLREATTKIANVITRSGPGSAPVPLRKGQGPAR